MNWQAILLSVFGSICAQLLNLAELSKTPKSRRPDFKDYAYWLPFIIYPVISAVIAYAYFDSKADVNKMLAIQIGASSPLIIKSLANAVPNEITSISGKRKI
ncbi:hypothetical protein [Mucilaginibacter arboris]|uniref:Uncharacterized protein n=1 Tax=Mucilaginibacter arboris TaxID=2682090 RepID=A0A7K1SSQ7_9SPHI|nr:hypothetical protein [Mucilaginibacter arboris]MVN20343.1 hypothetical protein [Mucilaginibacter arboris]